jgi:hypothetical protein
MNAAQVMDEAPFFPRRRGSQNIFLQIHFKADFSMKISSLFCVLFNDAVDI